MATNPMSLLLRHLRHSALPRRGDGLSDAQLLTCFAEGRDEAAFAALVHRHAPMVWGVCRRVLDDDHDAEDAFQATFLVLVRKARSVVPRERVANWLHGVARTTALRARSLNARRKARERHVAALPEPAVWAPDPINDLRSLLDAELSRLPEKYRLPLVLCDLEERPLREAAQHLGWPQGTVAGRLARARAMLAKRLARRGLALSGGALAGILAGQSAPAAVVSSTVQAALLFLANPAASGVLSTRVAVLMEGVSRSMMLSKAKAAAAALVVAAVSLTALGGGVAMTYPAAAPQDNEAKDERPALDKPKRPTRPPPPPRAEPAPTVAGEDKTDLDRLQGVWSVISVEQGGKPDKLEKAVFIVDGKRACWQTSDGEIQGGLYLNPTCTPKTFDLAMTNRTQEGIYAFQDDNLLMCFVWMDFDNDWEVAKRPARFATKPGSQQIMVKLKKLHGKEVFPYRRPDGTRTFPTFVERGEAKDATPAPPPRQPEPPSATVAEPSPAVEPDGERLSPPHHVTPRQVVVRLKRDLLMVRTADVTHEPVPMAWQGRRATSYQRVVVERTRYFPIEAAKVYDLKGKRISREKLAELLKKETLALFSTDEEAADPSNLRLYKEGTLLFVFPAPTPPQVVPDTPPPGVAPAPVPPPVSGLSPAGPIRPAPALPTPPDGVPVPPSQSPQWNYPPGFMGSHIPSPNPRYAPTVPLGSPASPPPATPAPSHK